MSLVASLNNALSGLRAVNTGISVTSDNIANAMTEGFHKRELSLTSRFGGGVSVSSVDRYVDDILSGQMYHINSGISGQNVRTQAFNEFYNSLGLHSELGDIHQHMSDLKSLLIDAPVNSGAQHRLSEITAKAEQFAQGVNRYSANITEQKSTLSEAIARDVKAINDTLSKIAAVNGQIAKAGQAQSNHLADQRDVLLRELSDKLPISVRSASDGTVKIYTDKGMPLLDRGIKPLEFDGSAIWQRGTNTSQPIIKASDFGNGTLASGSLSARVQILHSDIPRAEQEVAKLISAAQNLPDMFNATSGNLAISFGLFEGTASQLEVNRALLGHATLMNGSSIDVGSITIKPQSAIAIAIGDLSDVEQSALDISALVGREAKLAEAITADMTLQREALEGIFAQSNVKLEDEAFNLVTLQNAFEANARVLQVVDEMHQALLRI